MIAFVDESMRQKGGGLYLIAAVAMLRENAELMRSEALGLPLPYQERVHWHDENESRRLDLLKRMVLVELDVSVYLHRPCPNNRQDRGRALCLEGLLWDARERGLRELVIESRQERNDRKDRQTIIHAQRARKAPEGLRYRHLRPREEPLLWLADMVAGAWSARLAGEGESYDEFLTLLGGNVRDCRR